MGLARDIMGGGFSGGQVAAIAGRVQTAISAAGTVITDATDLTASFNMISTAAASAGVQLPLLQAGESLLVYNGGANAVRVYPGSSTVAINQIAAGSAHILAQYTACIYYGISSTVVAGFLSA